jgi:hypothetical protein
MSSKDPKMSNQGTPGKSQYVTSMIPQELEIIERLQSGKSMWLWLHTRSDLQLSTIQRNRTNDNRLCESVKGLSKQQTLKQPILAQLVKVLYQWFTAVPSKGKPMTGPILIEKVMPFYDKMKITDKCSFSDGWLQNLGSLMIRNILQSSTCPVS